MPYSDQVEATLIALPPLFLDSAFGFTYRPTADAVAPPVFTGEPLALTLTRRADGERVTLTEADAVLSGGGTVIAFDKPAGWTAANLGVPAGATEAEYELHLHAGGVRLVGCRFTAVVPPGGRIDPS